MPAAQLGILLLADYIRTLCKESGAEALGWCAGLAGRCLVLAAVFPLLEEVCQRIWGWQDERQKYRRFLAGLVFLAAMPLNGAGFRTGKPARPGNCGSPT